MHNMKFNILGTKCVQGNALKEALNELTNN
jgi:hypothetical protein